MPQTLVACGVFRVVLPVPADRPGDIDEAFNACVLNSLLAVTPLADAGIWRVYTIGARRKGQFQVSGGRHV